PHVPGRHYDRAGRRRRLRRDGRRRARPLDVPRRRLRRPREDPRRDQGEAVKTSAPPVSAVQAPPRPTPVAAPATDLRRYYRVPKRLVRGVLLVMVVALFIVVVGFGFWLRALGNFLVVPERLPAHADAIVVLGGGDRHGTRETQAAQLYAQGIAPVVL